MSDLTPKEEAIFRAVLNHLGTIQSQLNNHLKRITDLEKNLQIHADYWTRKLESLERPIKRRKKR